MSISRRLAGEVGILHHFVGLHDDQLFDLRDLLCNLIGV